MIIPVAAGDIIAFTSDGIVVLMHVAIDTSLLPQQRLRPGGQVGAGVEAGIP